jgi:hypothetical protein
MMTIEKENNICKSAKQPENCSPSIAKLVPLIPEIKMGTEIGNAKTAKRVPLALACAIIAAIIVATDDSPILPIINIIKKALTFPTSTPIIAKYNGIMIISNEKSNTMLNSHFPINIEFGTATSLKVSDVCCSSSLTKIWDNPDMDEKNRIIHNNGDNTSLLKFIGPIEKLIAISVVIANNIIAFIAYLVRNSNRRSFKNI